MKESITVLLIVAIAVTTVILAGVVPPEKLDRGHVVNTLRALKVPDSLIAETEGLPIFRTPDKFVRLSEDGQTAMIMCVDSCAIKILFEEGGVKK